eukprot:7592962-Pyramimonas_sp.AAC.1
MSPGVLGLGRWPPECWNCLLVNSRPPQRSSDRLTHLERRCRLGTATIGAGLHLETGGRRDTAAAAA